MCQFMSSPKGIEYSNENKAIFCFWLLGFRFKTFILCPHLLVVSKVRQSLKNVINFFFLFFLNVIIIYILWLNLKGVLLIKGLERITI
jgi:hypothetical protein